MLTGITAGVGALAVFAGIVFALGRWQRRRYLREFREGTGGPGQSVFVKPR